MKFNINKLQYAYTKYGIEFIDDATKDFEYFLDKDMKVNLVLADGQKNVKHWRKKSNIDESTLRSVFGNSESIEHYNEKIRISLIKNFEHVLKNGYKLVHKPKSSVTEYRLHTGQIVDVAFFDSYDVLMFCVEVFNTHRKSKNDIIKFNNVNAIVYEYDIHTKKMYPISAGAIGEKIRSRLKRGEVFIREIKARVQGLRGRVTLLEKEYWELEDERRKSWSDYYKFKEEIEFESERIEENIRYIKNSIQYLTF